MAPWDTLLLTELWVQVKPSLFVIHSWPLHFHSSSLSSSQPLALSIWNFLLACDYYKGVISRGCVNFLVIQTLPWIEFTFSRLAFSMTSHVEMSSVLRLDKGVLHTHTWAAETQ